MSATEPLSHSGPEEKGDQPTHEEPESPTPPTDLPETHHGPSIESLHQTEMSTEPHAESHNPAGLVDVQTDPAAESLPAVAAPSHPDRLAGQVEALSLSVKIPESGLSSTTNTPPPPPPPEKDDSYLNSNPNAPVTTPQPSAPNSRPSSEKELPDVPGDSDPETNQTIRNNGARDDTDSQPEIQNIMGQFQDPTRTTGQQEIMSPRLELAEQFRTSQHFPPRRSSLEPVHSPGSGPSRSAAPHTGQTVPGHRHSVGPEELTLTRQSSASTIPPPPEPEPDQPFDFHRFLEQLRHRTADPVAKFLRSFLTEFAKKQWMAHEQVKIISDFLAFITNKMAMCEVWRDVSDAEFDNAKEGMEKLVMNRLYSQTFSPAIPAPPTIPRSTSRSRRREIERLHGPWRRGQHQEDIERDDILAQKIRIYSWVKEEHLDIAPVSGSGRRFLTLAQQGMLLSSVAEICLNTDWNARIVKDKWLPRSPR